MDLDLTHYCSMLLDPFLAVDLVQTFHLTDEFCIFILKPDSRSSSTVFLPYTVDPRSQHTVETLALYSGFLSLTCLYVERYAAAFTV